MCPSMWKRKMDNFMCLLEFQCAKRLNVHSQATPAHVNLIALEGFSYNYLRAQKNLKKNKKLPEGNFQTDTSALNYQNESKLENDLSKISYKSPGANNLCNDGVLYLVKILFCDSVATSLHRETNYLLRNNYCLVLFLSVVMKQLLFCFILISLYGQLNLNFSIIHLFSY